MNISACDLSEIPQFPHLLQVLVIDLSMISRLPRLPTNLKILKVTRSKLQDFPEIEFLLGLETVSFHDCYVEADLSFNKINKVDWSCINPGLTELNFSFNFLIKPPPGDITAKIQFDHNNCHAKYAMQRNIKIQIIEKDKNGMPRKSTTKPEQSEQNKKDGGNSFGVYDNPPENVHYISIQESAAASLEIIMMLCPHKKANKNFISETLKRHIKSVLVVRSIPTPDMRSLPSLNGVLITVCILSME
jgi:hypothetical protein